MTTPALLIMSMLVAIALVALMRLWDSSRRLNKVVDELRELIKRNERSR